MNGLDYILKRQNFFCVLFCLVSLFSLKSLSSYGQTDREILLPHGFVTYSRGETYDRELCRAEISPGMTFEQIHATERLIVEKGPYGGDITGQISFDGKWIAFARSLSGRHPGSGGNDYADFSNWDIYIARIDGDLPVEPIRIGHGYFPSWGEDSSEDIKTLYFSVNEIPAIHKVKINGAGEIVEEESEVARLPQEGYEGFAFAAPNGEFAAYRKNGAVYTYWFSGANKGKSILMTGGCHPHVTADSKWVYHANRHAVRSDGSARGESGAGGLYHYGSSNDLNWFVTRTEGDNTIINKGRESWLCTLYETDERFDTEKAVKISDMAGFIDIHVYPDRPSKKAASFNRKTHEAFLSGHVLLSGKALKESRDNLAKEFRTLPVSKEGETFVWEDDQSDGRIINVSGAFLRSSRLVPESLAYLGLNGRMRLCGGSFRATDKETIESISQSAHQTNQLSIELQFVSFSDEVSGPARIASCSKSWAERNWTIGQEGKDLKFRLRTPENGVNGTNSEITLGQIEVGKPYHLVLSYTSGNLVWLLNGVLGQSKSVVGDLSNWDTCPLIFGDELTGDRSWYGEIRGVHLYAYALSINEMKQSYRRAKSELSQLVSGEPIYVEAEIIENSEDPTIEQIEGQGYSRCLTTRHMRVLTTDNREVLPEGKEFILKEWTILGLKQVNQREEGQKYRLKLYDALAHKELLNEYTVEGLSVFDLPLYYSSQIDGKW